MAEIEAGVLARIIDLQQNLTSADFDLEKFLVLGVEKMAAVTGATGVVIELVEDTEMVYRAATGTGAPFKGLRLKKEGSISGLCVIQNKVLISEDTEKDNRVDHAACHKVQARSLVVAPLIHKSKPIGVIKIFSKMPFAFDQDDITVLKIMAGFIASALAHQIFFQEKHALFEEKTKALENLKIAHDKLSKANLELKRSELIKSKLAAIVENTNDAIVSRDLNGHIESWNKGAEVLFGYKEDEVLGKYVDFLYPSNKKTELNFTLQQIKEGKKVDLFDTERVHKDGHIVPVSVMQSPIRNKAGQIIGYCGIARDNTELKKLMTLKNDLISVVSHELRTPITAIYGSLTLLVSGTMGEFDAEVMQLLEIGVQNCERLLRLINDTLDMQKIESGKMDFNFKKINIGEVVIASIEANQGYASKFNINIQTLALINAMVNIDYDKIMQVITNLISNAIKFSSGKTINVHVEKIGNLVRVGVTNQGKGIPVALQAKVFQKFSQINSENTIKGTGLGLSISKEIIERHQGSIHFTSEENKETTFYFDLPIVE